MSQMMRHLDKFSRPVGRRKILLQTPQLNFPRVNLRKLFSHKPVPVIFKQRSKWLVGKPVGNIINVTQIKTRPLGGRTIQN